MTHPTLDEHRAQWLSMIRYQLMNARQESNAPAPLSSMALNTMQDAVESMLRLTGEALGVDFAAREEFDKMLAKVVVKLGAKSDLLGYSSSLKSMNRARVNFKHNGNRADASTVRQHMDTAEAAINALARDVFSVELADVSLLLLVPNRIVRMHLEAAEAHRTAGNQGESLTDLAIAFDELLRDYERRKSSWGSFFSTKPSFSGGREFRAIEDTIRPVMQWLEAIDRQLRVISMGVDAQEYAHFRTATPSLMHFMDGSFGANFPVAPDDIAIDDATFARCVKFVIDTSLRLSATDFEVPERTYNTSAMIRRSADEIAALRAGLDDGNAAIGA